MVDKSWVLFTHRRQLLRLINLAAQRAHTVFRKGFVLKNLRGVAQHQSILELADLPLVTVLALKQSPLEFFAFYSILSLFGASTVAHHLAIFGLQYLQLGLKFQDAIVLHLENLPSVHFLTESLPINL